MGTQREVGQILHYIVSTAARIEFALEFTKNILW